VRLANLNSLPATVGPALESVVGSDPSIDPTLGAAEAVSQGHPLRPSLELHYIVHTLHNGLPSALHLSTSAFLLIPSALSDYPPLPSNRAEDGKELTRRDVAERLVAVREELDWLGRGPGAMIERDDEEIMIGRPPITTDGAGGVQDDVWYSQTQNARDVYTSGRDFALTEKPASADGIIGSIPTKEIDELIGAAQAKERSKLESSIDENPEDLSLEALDGRNTNWSKLISEDDTEIYSELVKLRPST